ncbi:hypothetical protein ACHAXM_000819 [Skeletonema potamos]
MNMMVQSVNAMPDSPEDKEAWKITLFSRWYIEYFYVSVHEHHDAEEHIYFPWMKTKASIPEKEFGNSHEELMSAMGEIKKCCVSIIAMGGKGCRSHVATLKEIVPKFHVDMKAHLKEEEEIVPALLRAHFTMTEEFYSDFLGSIPPPIKHLVTKYYMPDFENVVSTMRDAPTLESEPKLKRVPCCGIPFCFPCLM